MAFRVAAAQVRVKPNHDYGAIPEEGHECDPKDHYDGMMNPSGRFQTPSWQELTTQ